MPNTVRQEMALGFLRLEAATKNPLHLGYYADMAYRNDVPVEHIADIYGTSADVVHELIAQERLATDCRRPACLSTLKGGA